MLVVDTLAVLEALAGRPPNAGLLGRLGDEGDLHAPHVIDIRNLTAYDAAFVALSEGLDVPLVTCDAKMRSAPGHQARVEVYAGRLRLERQR